MGPKSYKEFIKTVNEEEEGRMYLDNLQEIASFASQIREMIAPEDELEAWVQDKITIAHHNMDAILGYLKSLEKGGTNSVSQGGSTNMNLG
jgi:hypothetical protein